MPMYVMTIKSILNKKSVFTIGVLVHTVCNYSCKYCPIGLHDGMFKDITTEDYIRFFENLLLDNPHILDHQIKKITFTGGEPTLFPKMELLLKYVKNNNFDTVMISNGSASVEYYDNIFDMLNVLVVSCHPRYANFKHLTEIIKTANLKNTSVAVNLVMDPKYWDRALEGIEVLKDSGAAINIKGLQDWGPTTEVAIYSEEQKQFLKENTLIEGKEWGVTVKYTDDTSEHFDGQKILINKLNKFKGYKCDAGKSNLRIEADGRVFGSVCKANYFGNLFEDRNLRVTLPKHGIICPKESCKCVSDLTIDKEIS